MIIDHAGIGICYLHGSMKLHLGRELCGYGDGPWRPVYGSGHEAEQLHGFRHRPGKE